MEKSPLILSESSEKKLNISEELVSVREISDNLGTSYDTVNNAVKRLFPESVKNGKKTLLSESQVTMLLDELKNNKTVNERITFEVSSKVSNASTEQSIQKILLKIRFLGV